MARRREPTATPAEAAGHLELPEHLAHPRIADYVPADELAAIADEYPDPEQRWAMTSARAWTRHRAELAAWCAEHHHPIPATAPWPR